MATIDFFGEFDVTLQGDGEVIDSLREYYGRFLREGETRGPDLTVQAWASPPSPEKVYGDPETYYGRAGDRFVIRDGSNFVSLDREWCDIRTAPETNHFFVSYLVEFALRRQFAAEGRVLVHASGLVKDGTTYVFPAWRHTGKTNTLLALLRDGGDYLSDDRVWIDRDGTVWGYPLPVNLLPYNAESFPDVSLASRIDRLRAAVSDAMMERFDRLGPIHEKILYFLAKFYIDVPLGEVVAIEEILPDVGYRSTAELDELVLLRTAPERGSPELEPISSAEAHAELTSTSHYEWNARIEEYARIFDTLFGTESRTSEVEALVDTEGEILRDLVETTQTARLHLPREERWAEKGLTRAVREEVLQQG